MKRLLSIVTAAVFLGSLFVVPASAQATVPAEPNIVDPAGDANYINNNNTLGQSGNNHVTGQDASSLADILAVWLTHDANNISIHVQTEAPQPSSGAAYIVFFRANADDCLRAEFAVAAPSYQGDSYAEVEDTCGELDPAAGEVVSVEGPDGTGIITATFPRSYSASFADGAVIATPRIEMRNLNGGPVSLRGPTIDNTDPGTDYTITAGDSAAEEPNEEEEPEKDKKAKKDKSKKKNKKKKKGKPKVPAACPAYAPGELGTDQPMVTVTDAATEESPLEQTVEVAESVADLDLAGLVLDAEYAYFNVQVDTDSADTGLYAYVEFSTRRDYDLGFLYPDESYAARARSFNPVVGTPAEIFSAPGHGGEGTDHSEKIVGIRTADCGGYTLEFANWFGEGGEFAIQLWLGEAVNDPLAPGEEPR